MRQAARLVRIPGNPAPAFGAATPTAEPVVRESMVVPAAPVVSTADALANALSQLGVERAFGVFGGAIAPFCEALNRSPIDVVHFRHEAGAAFAAIEASIATGRPVVVVATTGPGLSNTISGMIAARWEGARVVFVSAMTPAAQRGRFAFQESSAQTLPLSGLFAQGSIFHFAATLESPDEIAPALSRIASGLARPGGFVAHLAMPIALQTAPCRALPSRVTSMGPPSCSAESVEACAQLLSSEPFVIWAGFGARDAADAIRALSDRTGAPVMCSPRAKGLFPEEHPRSLGVTGLGGTGVAEAYMTRVRPARVLVLGTRLGEFTSFWRGELAPAAGFVHVDLDPEAFGAAYPNAPTVGIQADVRTFVTALLDALPDAPPRESAPVLERHHPVAIAPRDEAEVRPSFLMQAIQRVVVDASDAPVITEAGNSFVLGTYHLRFSAPRRYRVSTGFGSMGHAVAGVVGMAMARKGKAVAVAGDGAMLMLSEVNTAVQHRAQAVWIVLNDARYGMIEQGMKSIGWTPFGTAISRCDFVAIARGMGADGVRVEHEHELEAALRRAMDADGPFVVDVAIDPRERAPSNARNASLVEQGVSARPPANDG